MINQLFDHKQSVLRYSVISSINDYYLFLKIVTRMVKWTDTGKKPSTAILAPSHYLPYPIYFCVFPNK